MELCFQRKDQDIMLKRKLSRLFPVGLAFLARGHVAMSGDILSCHGGAWGTTGISGVETRGAAKQPTMHRAAPHKE